MKAHAMIHPYGKVYPAMQAATPKAVALVGVGTSGNRGYKINCLDWVWLSPADKLKSAINVDPRNPQGVMRAIEQHCNAKISKGVNPAGQAGASPQPDMVFDSAGNSYDTATGTAYDANGNVVPPTPTTIVPPDNTQTTAPSATPETSFPSSVTLPPAYSETNPTNNTPGAVTTASTNFGPTGNVTSTTSGNTTSNPLLTPQQETALFSAVGSILNTTGSAIASAIQSNNQMQLARMQSQAQIEIATLQAESQRSMAAGNMTLAQQQIQQMGQLQQFNGVLSAQSQQTIGMYVIGAIVALGIIGAVVYFMPKGPSGTQAITTPVASTPTPSRTGSTRRSKR